MIQRTAIEECVLILPHFFSAPFPRFIMLFDSVALLRSKTKILVDFVLGQEPEFSRKFEGSAGEIKTVHIDMVRSEGSAHKVLRLLMDWVISDLLLRI